MKLSCCVCQKSIQDVFSAMVHPSDGMPVHFECAIQAVEELLKPKEGEKVIYCGKGCFAIISSQNHKQRKLKFIRSIEWEKHTEIVEWRKKLQETIS